MFNCCFKLSGAGAHRQSPSAIAAVFSSVIACGKEKGDQSVRDTFVCLVVYLYPRHDRKGRNKTPATKQKRRSFFSLSLSFTGWRARKCILASNQYCSCLSVSVRFCLTSLCGFSLSLICFGSAVGKQMKWRHFWSFR